jgi:hypothetical protein
MGTHFPPTKPVHSKRHLDRLLRNLGKLHINLIMSFNYARKGLTHRESIPHKSRIVDEHKQEWQLGRFSNFDQVARAWATKDVDPEITSYLVPLANIKDTKASAAVIQRAREALTPQKTTPAAVRQAAYVLQQGQAATGNVPNTPTVGPAPPTPPVLGNPGANDEGKAGEEEIDVTALTKLTPLTKVHGQVNAHLRNILSAQNLDFLTNATQLGKQESSLEPYIVDIDVPAFRAEMLRIFNATYSADDRVEQIRKRITEFQYNPQGKLTQMVHEITSLSTDIAAFPQLLNEMYITLNRNIWRQLKNCHEPKIQMMANSIDLTNMDLEATRKRLLKLHTDIEESGGYKQIRAHTASAGGANRPKCPSCLHNFNMERYHKFPDHCRSNPSTHKDNPENLAWHEGNWKRTHPNGTDKKPYDFAQAPQMSSGQSPVKRPRSF